MTAFDTVVLSYSIVALLYLCWFSSIGAIRSSPRLGFFLTLCWPLITLVLFTRWAVRLGRSVWRAGRYMGRHATGGHA